MSSYKYLHISLFMNLILKFTYGQVDGKFFRSDYQYDDEMKSFYKIHTIQKSWEEAKKVCEWEGATLYYPDDDAEADYTIAYWNSTQPFSWVWIGISESKFVKHEFRTVDGQPIHKVYNRWGPGEPNNAGGKEGCVILRRDGTMNDDICRKNYPFICKKSLTSLEWNDLCNNPDPMYKFNNQLSRCYKFHLTPSNWSEAAMVCSAEHSYLAIINSDEEAAHLAKITAEAPKDSVSGHFLRGAVHLGFAKENDDWITIQGTPLKKSGYTKWGNGQPDGGDKEQCGSMFYQGTLNDIGCDQKAFFICELEVDIITNFENRFGVGIIPTN